MFLILVIFNMYHRSYVNIFLQASDHKKYANNLAKTLLKTHF